MLHIAVRFSNIESGDISLARLIIVLIPMTPAAEKSPGPVLLHP